MKYLVLIQDDPAVRELFAAMSEEERRASFQVYWDVERDLRASGELIDSKALDTGAQRFVRRTDGAPLVTDAPPPETTAAVSGYYLVEVADEERAAAIAARFPEAAAEAGVRIARVWTDADFAAYSAT